MPIAPPTLDQLSGLADSADTAAAGVSNYATQGVGIQDKIKQRAQQILDSKLNLVDQRNKAEDYFFSLQGGDTGATGAPGSDTARVSDFGQKFGGGAIVNPASTLNAQSSLLDQAYGNVRNVIQDQEKRGQTVADIANTGANEFNKRLQGLQSIAESATREYQKASDFYKLQQDKEQADRAYSEQMRQFNVSQSNQSREFAAGKLIQESTDIFGNKTSNAADVLKGLGFETPKGQKGSDLLAADDGTLIKSRLPETTNKNGGKECAEYVNDITGAGLGSTYQSKLDKAKLTEKDIGDGVGSVAVWQPGSVPSKYGHTGIIMGDDGQGNWIIKSSNYHLDGKISTDKVPKSKIEGYTAPLVKPSAQYAQQTGAQSTAGEFSGEDYKLAKDQGRGKEYLAAHQPGAQPSAEITTQEGPDISQVKTQQDAVAYLQAGGDPGALKAKATTPEALKAIDTLINSVTGGSSGGAQLPAGSAANIADAQVLPTQLNDLKSLIDTSSDIFGPLKGRLGGIDPTNVKAQTAQSKITAVTQVVGKYMEGGVLRAEDTKKYEKILPSLNDKPEVARAKIENVVSLLQSKYRTDIQSFANAGYDVSKFPQELDLGVTPTAGSSTEVDGKLSPEQQAMLDAA